jgi:hypothetical protein
MSWILDVINFFTPEQWAVIGGLIATATATWGITALVKIRHFKKEGEKLWQGWVNLNVAVWPVVLTFVGAALANLHQMTGLFSLIPIAAPYAAKYGPTVTVALLTTHTVVTAIAKFWQDRKVGTPISNVNYTPPVLTQSSSMGVQSAGVPKEQLIQL